MSDHNMLAVILGMVTFLVLSRFAEVIADLISAGERGVLIDRAETDREAERERGEGAKG